MKLIDEWRHGWKMFSVQANALAISLIGAYQMIPEDFKHAIPQSWMMAAASALVAIGTIGRFINQDIPKEGNKDGNERQDSHC